jgi:hypothetical protein
VRGLLVDAAAGASEQASETSRRMESGREALRSCECESSQSGGGVQRGECASSTRAQARPPMLSFTLVQQQCPGFGVNLVISRVSC